MDPAPAHNPSAYAREALKQLAQQRLPPTPDNFARVYFELVPGGRAASALGATDMLRALLTEWPRRDGEMTRAAKQLETALGGNDWEAAKHALLALAEERQDGSEGVWAEMIRELVRLLEMRHAGLTPARKRESLEYVLSAFGGDGNALYPRLKGLLRNWADTPLARDTIAPAADAAAPEDADPSAHEAAARIPTAVERDDEVPPLLRELLAQTLTFGVVERLGYNAELADHARRLAQRARDARDRRAVGEFAGELKQFWITLEIRGEDQQQIQQSLLRLLHLLVRNVGELIGEDQWLKGQVDAFAALLGNPLDSAGLANVERSLRDVVLKQGILKHAMDEAKASLKSMVGTFVERLSALSLTTGDYQARIERHAQALQSSNDLTELSAVVRDIMDDTRGLQADIVRSHEELVSAQRKADDYERKVHSLELELESMSALVHEDQLTSTLNRRGLEGAYVQEAARSDRRGTLLVLAILDLDNFKQVNDRLGHQAGDQALIHLAGVIRRTLRPTDIIARYGGEEFVVLLPETGDQEAARIMLRLQRELTRRFFLHNRERVLITFSAGVAQRTPGETREALIARADRALLQAKQAGKNRVVVA